MNRDTTPNGGPSRDYIPTDTPPREPLPLTPLNKWAKMPSTFIRLNAWEVVQP